MDKPERRVHRSAVHPCHSETPLARSCMSAAPGDRRSWSVTHYRSDVAGAIFQSIRIGVIRRRSKGFMSSRLLRRFLLAAALLSCGLTSFARAADIDPRVSTSEVLTSQTTGVGVFLPSNTLTAWLLASTERDVHGGRVATQLDSLYRQRLCVPRARDANCGTLPACDDAGRLLRAGLHSSSLGTPPPLS